MHTCPARPPAMVLASPLLQNEVVGFIRQVPGGTVVINRIDEVGGVGGCALSAPAGSSSVVVAASAPCVPILALPHPPPTPMQCRCIPTCCLC